MARRIGRSRPADITDLERGARPITEEVIRSYESVLGQNLSSISREASIGAQPDGRFEVIHYELTAHVGIDGVIRRERHRLHFRVFDGPVNLYFFMEEFRDEATPLRFFEMSGGRFGRTKNPDSEVIEYVVNTRVELQPGDEHSILFECVDETGPRDLVIFPTRRQTVRLLDIRLWLPPELVQDVGVLQVHGVPPRGVASEATERQPLSLTPNGLAEAHFRNPKAPLGYGVLMRSTTGGQRSVPAEELLALSQPEQGKRLRQLRLQHQFDRAQIQRRIGLTSPSMLSQVESGKRPASVRIIQGYLDLTSDSLQQRRSARPPENVPLIKPARVHWDVAIEKHGLGTVMQELTFECLADGVTHFGLGVFEPDEIDDAIDVFENLEGGRLEVRDLPDERKELVCRFTALMRGERHTLRYFVLPDRPDTLSRYAEGEERATVSAWYKDDWEVPTFTIHAVSGVPAEYKLGERLPSRCLTPLQLSPGHYLRHEFYNLELGLSYGLWLEGLDVKAAMLAMDQVLAEPEF